MTDRKNNESSSSATTDEEIVEEEKKRSQKMELIRKTKLKHMHALLTMRLSDACRYLRSDSKGNASAIQGGCRASKLTVTLLLRSG
ncbi:hypothetical protein M514_24291 [Trichuris suis]|uniref:Uncharacterized protein n=1 Tax=Trichuris suis TaxID=68888 RepID=A0A085N1Y6_9BILA|nr:hypothetical protein M514_24291 [Trichuris suis]